MRELTVKGRKFSAILQYWYNLNGYQVMQECVLISHAHTCTPLFKVNGHQFISIFTPVNPKMTKFTPFMYRLVWYTLRNKGYSRFFHQSIL
jgi:hypothetical protein